MCGIVGYVGSQSAVEFLLAGLRRLEYRGYDSAGVATAHQGRLDVVKSAGRVDDLARKLPPHAAAGAAGIGHTRWATHGPANDVNAHPHLSADGSVAVVHNGVIENFRPLKQRLIEQGIAFASATDSEVVAQLIACELAAAEADPEALAVDPYAPLVAAVQGALAQLQGTFGLAIMFRDWPEAIVAARLGSPLVIGVGDSENFLASDASPLAGRTERIVYLADHEIAVVTAHAIRVIHREQGAVDHRVQRLAIDAADVELGGFPHFMLKEIFEQPETVRNAMRGRIDRDAATAKFGGLNLSPRRLRAADRLLLTA
ncbi:MAG TPA: glutamine--fructose-6-phosphate aminotransferase, partial [Lacipirellulaceae bacterium]|nr:glutamine--fructose-6-phosphate aminotransferase [Lacipirellulaceae bacterium]